MELEPGVALGRYRVERRIGQGGMGVVWKAVDTSLGRAVAIKLLPDALSRDLESTARLEREARLLAALNHPLIAAIHGLERAGDVLFLVMEFVEGESLAERRSRGPMPPDEVSALASQLAEGLEAAHERGIVHRDLKPANVQMRPDGTIKILDFGLARSVDSGAEASIAGAAAADSPTISAMLTGPNVILGTAPYLSPEQARGRAVDKRTDVWAYGVVVFEMLTGRALFAGETVSDTVAAVLRQEIDWSALPAETPRRLVSLLRRCLEREPRNRLRDIGEARIALAGAGNGWDAAGPEAGSPATTARRGAGWRRLAPVAAGVVVGAVLVFAAMRLSSPDRPADPARKFVLSIPGSGPISEAVIAPDGSAAAYVRSDSLWVAEFGRTTPSFLVAGRGLSAPAWSPDSRVIAYVVGTRILAVDVADGTSRTLAETGTEFVPGAGLAWSDAGVIVASQATPVGLLELPEGGGEVEVAVPVDTTQEGDFHDPRPLPGGRGTLAVVHRKGRGADTLVLFARGKRTVLLQLDGQTIARPSYSPSGHLVFERRTEPVGVWAVPFSLQRLRTTGKPFLVVAQATNPSVARDGTLLYVAKEQTTTQFAWVDRTGRILDRVGQARPDNGLNFRLAPDDSRIAATFGVEAEADLWLIDTRRGTHQRLTFDAGFEAAPDWSPGGNSIVYQATGHLTDRRRWRVLMRAADGSGVADTLSSGGYVLPSFTPDGTSLIMTKLVPEGTSTLERIVLYGDRTPTVLVGGEGTRYGWRVSPDGRYVAYVDHASGQPEVYLRRFPEGEGRWQVSASGGRWPRWSRSGERLYFVQGETVMETEVTLAGSPALSAPRALFTRRSVGRSGPFDWTPHFDVSRDGQRFLILVPGADESGTNDLVVAQNWSSAFRSLPGQR